MVSYLSLPQTNLAKSNNLENDDYQHFASQDLYTILKLTESFGTNNKNVSLLIHGVLDESRKSYKSSVEKNIRIQKENELTEKEFRLQKENDLDAEIQLRVQRK